MKGLLPLAAVLSLSGCCLAPNSVRPELQHLSHASQHAPFTSHPTNYGANTLELMAHWDLPHAYVEIGEGIALESQWATAEGAHGGCGEIEGPREQFIARFGLVIPTR